MNNKFLHKFNNIISIKIRGRNVYKFISKLIKLKIPIYNLNIINRKEAILKINYNDYKRIKKENRLYDLEDRDYYGKLKFKNFLKKNMIFIIFLLYGLVLLKILSSLIFEIQIIHSNKEIRNLVEKELYDNDIKLYHFQKNYEQLEKIEDKILFNNKDKLEWIEIENIGTKYLVKIEERKINDSILDNQKQHIVASKNNVITKITASHGVILKNVGDYVKKGDVLISGNITLPDGSFVIGHANGKVYGEVWYTTTTFHPYIYKEEKLTGKVKDVYVLKFLNKRFSLFDFSKFKTFRSRENIILESSFSFLKFIKEKQYEVSIIDEVYTKEELTNKIISIASKKITDKLNDEEYIKSYYILDEKETQDGLSLKIFFSVVEEVGEVQVIERDNGIE